MKEYTFIKSNEDGSESDAIRVLRFSDWLLDRTDFVYREEFEGYIIHNTKLHHVLEDVRQSIFMEPMWPSLGGKPQGILGDQQNYHYSYPRLSVKYVVRFNDEDASKLKLVRYTTVGSVYFQSNVGYQLIDLREISNAEQFILGV